MCVAFIEGCMFKRINGDYQRQLTVNTEQSASGIFEGSILE